MNGLDVAPCPIQVLDDQPPVATFGPCLAAQQHGRDPEDVLVYRLLDPALPHELRKSLFVLRPSHATLPVGAEHLPGRGEPGLVEVLRAAELLQKEREVGTPSESGELGGVVEPYVGEAANAGLL